MSRFQQSLSGLRLSLALLLFMAPGVARAQSAANDAEPTILITVVHGDAVEAKLAQSATRVDLRSALADALRQNFGTVITPPLSDEEKQCAEVDCAVQITQRYRADILFLANTRISKDDPNQCTLVVLALQATAGNGKSSRDPVQRQIPTIACNEAALSNTINSIANDVFVNYFRLAHRTVPLCRYRYDNPRRGLATGLGVGLMVAGAGLGFGMLAEQQRTFTYEKYPGVALQWGNLSLARNAGFAVMGAGMALTGGSLLPWERMLHGPNLPECRALPQGRFGIGRTALVSFFASSLLASLASTIYFGVNGTGLPVMSSDPNVPSTAHLPTNYIVGSGVLLGVYTLGLTLSLALP